MAAAAYRLTVGASLGLLGAILLAGIGVGLAEELLFRGIVLTSLRVHVNSEARHAALEPVVRRHAPDQRAARYVTVGASGLLPAGMVVHGRWDISLFLPAGPDTPLRSLFELSAFVIMPIAGLISAGAVLAHDRKRRAANS
jgi:uncharacterized protein